MSSLFERLSRRFLLLVVLSAALLALPASVSADTDDPQGDGPAAVTTASDAATDKLHPKLEEQVESGSTETISVFVTVEGSAAPATALLDDAKVAQSGDAALVVGQISVQQLPKLAGEKGVVGVGPIELEQTGKPLGSPDPELVKPFNKQKVNEALQGLYKREVPYSKAPKLQGSNFEDLKKLAVLDAKTHDFADAWRAGFTGAGVTVGVLDGGTDFGHPDLIGTWQVWSNAPDPGWNGWPKAFDPFGTLQWFEPGLSQINQGLSWYTLTQEKTCALSGHGSKKRCSVVFATRTGPSRNFGVPAGTVEHTYTFPAGWTKSGTVRLGGHPDDHLLALFEERPAFLVADPNTAGTYDTIYVDLDGDFDFSDEKPVTKASPVSYRDMNGDGYTDLSGGLVYYISDGVTSVPGGIAAFGGIPGSEFAKGELVAWSGDYDPAIGGHGTQTASNIVGQGVINGLAPCFSDLEPRKGRHSTGAVRCSSDDDDDDHRSHSRGRGHHDDDDDDGGTYPGAVIGGAPHAKLAPYGDIYFSFDFSTQFGYFLATRNGVDITSNSYGSSDVDNDGYDAASQEADVIHNNRASTPLFSTGNGAPGFGTTAPPSPSAGISIGASTQFGGTGWDSIDRISQVVDNEVMVWSNRGFGATGSAGVDVVADGAFSAGDITLNTILNGTDAWLTWGGTSRSAPVAAGATALVYQAWRQANGPVVPAGFYRTAKDILKSSSLDLGYDTTTQGAGSVDAGDAVQTALGRRARVSPNEWRVGDYRGTEYPVFTHVVAPGGSDSQTFTLSGPGTWQVSDRMLTRTGSESLSFSSKQLANESPYNFNAPDYLMDLTGMVREHRDADLMVVRLNYPRAQFDGNADYEEDQEWRLLTYSWTDIDRDGRLWRDRDGDGVVDKTLKTTSSNIDGFVDIDFNRSEIDKGEYVRFMYHRAGANALQSFVRDPYEQLRGDPDGIFLGLQHAARNAAIPVTDFEVQIDFYENVDWPWVTTPSSAAGSFAASIAVPAGTPYGMYAGGIVLTRGGDSMVVPVTVAVAATAAQDADGALTGALTFGGEDVADAQSNSIYNNGTVFGASDWTWRAESGDWRFFYFDVPEEPAEGSLFLTQTQWQGTSPFTDLDTLIFGRSENQFQVVGDAVFGAPYILDTVGGSPNTNVGAGVWLFDTATGGPSDLVTAPAQEGLHALALHQVGWQGDDFHTPFEVTVGGASVTPTSVEETTADGTGSFDVTFTATVDLEGLEAEAFGLSRPTTETPTVQQDDPDDPSSASVKRDVTIEHASRLTVETELDQDIDLFVVFDENGDGSFTNDEIVAASATGTGNEFVELTGPEDGDYQVWVQGWSITGTPTATLTIDAVQGNDLTVSGAPAGAVPAGTPVTLTVDYAKADMEDGATYFGELLLGPPSAPTALAVPIEVTKTPAP